jgi:hypothetical protein
MVVNLMRVSIEDYERSRSIEKEKNEKKKKKTTHKLQCAIISANKFFCFQSVVSGKKV